jgi:hypothetical protein
VKCLALKCVRSTVQCCGNVPVVIFTIVAEKEMFVFSVQHVMNHFVLKKKN